VAWSTGTAAIPLQQFEPASLLAGQKQLDRSLRELPGSYAPSIKLFSVIDCPSRSCHAFRHMAGRFRTVDINKMGRAFADGKMEQAGCCQATQSCR
jgi:hypothetical protein